MSDSKTFEGTWHCTHWYPSNTHSGEDMSECDVEAHQDGKQLVLQSRPAEDGSYLLLRLTIDDDLATGTWHEVTAPEGHFHGIQYSGAMQMLVSKDGKKMEGKWAGIGMNYERNKPEIYTGRWELARPS